MSTVSKQSRPFNSPIHHFPCTGDCIPFYWNGEYHNFILANGGWAHFVSTDLIHWKEWPMALEKGKPDDPDGEACFTGCVMEHEGTFHIFYPAILSHFLVD